MKFFGLVVPYLHIIRGLMFSVYLLARYSSSLINDIDKEWQKYFKDKGLFYLNRFSSSLLDDVDASWLSDLQRQCIRQIKNVFSWDY